MSQRSAASVDSAQFNATFNEYSVDRLFEKYEEIGFIYPEKREILAPYFKEISNNWHKLRTCKEELLWILAIDPEGSDDFASVSVIKQSNFGLLAQHLVSNGNPFLSLKVMLYAQYRAEHICGDDEVKSSQNWFRPNNRYAYRIFASMYKKLGDDKAAIRHFDYLHMDLDQITQVVTPNYETTLVNSVDKELTDFVKAQYGNVFVRAEELDREDIELKTQDVQFQQYGMRRYRKVYKVTDAYSGIVMGCIVANRAPLGLNFSFLENRCYYILRKGISSDDKLPLLNYMNNIAATVYKDFELKKIPIVTDAHTSAQLQMLNADFLRIYIQSIWMREGFSMWYDHIQSFLDRIDKRNAKKNSEPSK